MSYLQDDCTAFVPAMGEVCAMPGADRRWVHDKGDHSQCMPEGCYGHEYQPPVEVPLTERPTVSYINVRPSDEGFANIAKAFIDSVLHDVPKARKQAVRDQLHQTLTIVGYLAQHNRADLAADVIAYVDASRE